MAELSMQVADDMNALARRLSVLESALVGLWQSGACRSQEDEAAIFFLQELRNDLEAIRDQLWPRRDARLSTAS
jgi:hypothetical protein